MNIKQLLPLASLGLFVSPMLACDGTDEGPGDAADQAEEGGEAGTEEGGETGTEEGGDEGEELDSDEDGLSDAEEAELGTDPNKKDTDEDNYWDSWEVLEGTDPLDIDSRIYQGWWPYDPDKDSLAQGTWPAASTEIGSQFPRDVYFDQHGDAVDIYDFANFTDNEAGEPTYLLIDMSALWCGPCHDIADWIAGVDNSTTQGLQQIYPSVREKVHTSRIWWVTFVVENVSGGPPTAADSQSWGTQHADPYIPVLADESQQVRNTYNGGSYPFFFLVAPDMSVEFWGLPGPGDNQHPALWFVQAYL